MDRLAKMQAYKREVLMSIRGSYGNNIPAKKVGNKFHAYAKECCKQKMKLTVLPTKWQFFLHPIKFLFLRLEVSLAHVILHIMRFYW